MHACEHPVARRAHALAHARAHTCTHTHARAHMHTHADRAPASPPLPPTRNSSNQLSGALGALPSDIWHADVSGNALSGRLPALVAYSALESFVANGNTFTNGLPGARARVRDRPSVCVFARARAEGRVLCWAVHAVSACSAGCVWTACANTRTTPPTHCAHIVHTHTHARTCARSAAARAGHAGVRWLRPERRAAAAAALAAARRPVRQQPGGRRWRAGPAQCARELGAA
jgi:hypothetical protein